jgi:hypothetical protein
VSATLLLAVVGAMPVAATEPLYVKNLSLVAGLSGLPAQRDAATADSGTLAVALHSSLANQYVSDSSRDEFLNFDGETLRFALELRYGLAQNWDVQLEVPWLDYSGGNMDDWIDDWHDLWGMPDGGRDDVANDQLDYRYANRDGTEFSLQDSTSGLGDISLSLTHAFYRNKSSVASLALGYKFSTGDEDDFLGSGGDDFFVALRFSGSQLSDLPLSWHGQVGYLRAGDNDVLGDIQEQDLWFAGLAVDWQVARRWSLIAQVDSHAAPTDSDITALGDDAIMATVGVRWRFAPNWSVDASVVEDIRVETASDVVFQTSLRYHPSS